MCSFFFFLNPTLFIYLLKIYYFFWPHHAAFGILVPRQGMEPGPQQWKHQVLTTGPPGNSPGSCVVKKKKKLNASICQVVGIQMDKLQMNEFPQWAQNTLQTAMHIGMNLPSHPTPPLISFIRSPWVLKAHKVLPSIYVNNTLLILINKVYKVRTN